MTVGKTCSSAHSCSGRRRWSRSAAIALVERLIRSICEPLHMSISLSCTDPFFSLSRLPISPHYLFIFSLLDTSRRKYPAFRSERNDVIFSIAFAIYFPEAVICPTLPLAVCSLFVFYHRYYLRTRLQYAMSIPYSTIGTRARSLLLFNKCIFLSPIFGRGVGLRHVRRGGLGRRDTMSYP
jgi:hypothetical protein